MIVLQVVLICKPHVPQQTFEGKGGVHVEILQGHEIQNLLNSHWELQIVLHDYSQGLNIVEEDSDHSGAWIDA